MSCATFAWGCWWTDLVMARFVPDVLPSIALVASIASVFAGVGLLTGLLCLRGRSRLWLAIATIPILANASLLATPLLLGDMKHFAQYRTLDAADPAPDSVDADRADDGPEEPVHGNAENGNDAVGEHANAVPGTHAPR